LQLALNLFDFRSIAETDSDFSGEDDVQHVNECVGRDVHQFSEHGLFLWELFAVAFVFAIQLPEVAGCKWMKITGYQLLRHRYRMTCQGH
jgi:hypothetical protein